MNPIDYDILVFKEGEAFISYCPELDLSSCGESIEQAKDMLRTAVRLFIEEADKMGTLDDILEESGYRKKDGGWVSPKLVATELASIS